jgi:hypothetical protein
MRNVVEGVFVIHFCNLIRIFKEAFNERGIFLGNGLILRNYVLETEMFRYSCHRPVTEKLQNAKISVKFAQQVDS